MRNSGRTFSVLSRGARVVMVTVLVLVLVVAADRLGGFTILDNSYYDAWHRLAGVTAPPQHVALVAVDDPSLLDHPQEPLVFWGPHFARALQTLREIGVQAVALDFLFAVDAESWFKHLGLSLNDKSRTHDLPLRAQLAEGRVALIGYLYLKSPDEIGFLLPLADYITVLPGNLGDIGLANLYSDQDGVVRRFLPALLDGEVLPRLALATLLAAQAAGVDPQSNPLPFPRGEIASTTTSRPIGFVGPPRTFPRISFRDLLEPKNLKEEDKRALKDKVVIIAGLYTGGQDIHLTPYAKPMSGAELHANIVETILTGRYPRPLPFWLHCLYLSALLGLATTLFVHFTPWRGLAAGLLLAAGGAGFSYLLFRQSWWLPVADLQAALVLSFLGTLGLRLTREERQRLFIQQVFSRYVSDEVVKRLLAAGRHPDLGGELLRVTVLLADIRDFTTISEKLQAPEVVELLNISFSRVCEPILAEGGMVDKFMGDAVLAIFGAPAPYPDHARRALAAAVSMRAIAGELRDWLPRRFPEAGLPVFRLGFGVHTGEAVIGNIGFAKRMEFTAIGDTVNLASRLQGKSRDLGWDIVASAATVAAAGPGVVTGRQAEVKVKGREEPVAISEVLGVGPEAAGGER